MSGTAAGPLSIVMVDSHRDIQRGGAVQCARLAAALARRGHRVTCVFDGPPGAAPQGAGFDRLRAAGVELRCYRLLGPGSALRFRREILARRPDILHTHKNMALRFVYAASLGRPDVPWVANRGTVYRLIPGTLARFIHRRRLDAVVAVAGAVRDALLRDGVPAERVHVIYGSFDEERFHPGVDGTRFRRLWGVPDGAPLVGMLASLRSRKKGQREFIAAAAKLLPRHPQARFAIVGEGDPGRLAEQARALGIADRVIFAGFVEETPAALAAMDVVVSASLRGEGLTGALREAMAVGRPVVSTDVAGNREIVRPGETGLLVPPGDPAALAEAVGRLLADPEQARALGAQGRRLMLECCTNEARAERVERLYYALLAERAGSRPTQPRAAA